VSVFLVRHGGLSSIERQSCFVFKSLMSNIYHSLIVIIDFSRAVDVCVNTLNFESECSKTEGKQNKHYDTSSATTLLSSLKSASIHDQL